MTLFAKYYKERLGFETIELNDAFVIYKCDKNTRTCIIQEIYVEPTSRRSGKASNLCDSVAANARAEGCRYLECYVWPGIEGADGALSAALKYGFRLVQNDGGRIILTKDIGG